MGHIISGGGDAARKMEEILQVHDIKKLFVVHDAAFSFLQEAEQIKSLSVPKVFFSDFTPNPLYEDVKKGVMLFRNEACEAILAVGGGSTIDVAKCIKLYCKMNPDQNYLSQPAEDSGVLLIAMPTTAGTGSEATRFAVIYYNGEKQSVNHESIIPDYAILEKGVLRTLPLYQKKCTLLDALCQAIESWWSVNSCEESRLYAKKAISLIMENLDAYLTGDESAAEAVLLASNYAGRAINLTQTTAAHAMSYKLTSRYHIPHGHAVAICLPVLWRHMLAEPVRCIDERGAGHLVYVFKEIAEALQTETPESAVVKFENLLARLNIEPPAIPEEDLDLLAASVNPDRLKNNPVALTREELRALYKKLADGSER